MNTIARLSGLPAPLSFAARPGCAATSTHEGTGEYLDDTMITAKVKAAIEERAVALARSAAGVKPVQDDIRIK